MKNIKIKYGQPIIILLTFLLVFVFLFYIAFPNHIKALARAESAGNQELFKLCQNQPLVTDKEKREVRILAQMQPAAFSDPEGGMPGYHLIVYRGGNAWRNALFISYVDDVTLHDALVSIGAVPGNNLTEAVWEERHNPDSSAPDRRIKGTPIEILVCWPKLKKPIPIEDILNDPGGQGLSFRFGGNKAIIPVWKSGCITCLYSCPGSKVGNESYTVRDYVRNATRFTLKEKAAPKKTTPAMLIFRIKEENKR